MQKTFKIKQVRNNTIIKMRFGDLNEAAKESCGSCCGQIISGYKWTYYVTGDCDNWD